MPREWCCLQWVGYPISINNQGRRNMLIGQSDPDNSIFEAFFLYDSSMCQVDKAKTPELIFFHRSVMECDLVEGA